MKEWYIIDTVDQLDSPALVVYADRVKENIRILKSFLPETHRLRPHVKTHKSADVSKLMMAAGISRFKCATIAEAEMLAQAGAQDVLLAYQPVGPKATRLGALMSKYPSTLFSCLVDNAESASLLSEFFESSNRQVGVFIDLNVGMNRTGIVPEKAYDLYLLIKEKKGLVFAGLHAYDGHLRDSDLAVRTRRCDECFAGVEALATKIRQTSHMPFSIVAGGTPTFPIHAKRPDVECSPGTFIYWDTGYRKILDEQPFLFAALVIARVISRPSDDTLCIDLGHKSIASENALTNRVSFLNAPELEVIGHSEEHMVARTNPGNSYQVGDVLYGVPYHVCPTCALYDTAFVVENHKVTSLWKIVSRNRVITL